jgi:DNA-directed RNA polymerase specialized sigma24 family protein
VAEARDELAWVLRALEQFPEADRAALLMRADEGLSYEEIAAALGMPVATVKVKVYRARLKLAQLREGERRAGSAGGSGGTRADPGAVRPAPGVSER